MSILRYGIVALIGIIVMGAVGSQPEFIEMLALAGLGQLLFYLGMVGVMYSVYRGAY